MRTFFIILLLVFTTLSAQDYLPGSLNIEVESGVWDFPREIPGVTVHFNGQMVVDSVMMSRGDMSYQVIPVSDFLRTQFAINLPADVVQLLGQFGAKSIRRGQVNFAPEDTLPHYREIRGSGKMIQSLDYNRFLIVEVPETVDINEAVESFKSNPHILSVSGNEALEGLISNPQ
ncbi:MAG: hypothetical protein WAN36_03895 [Calditrichia bacterium]